ncbi:phosphatidylglycerophosphatase A [Deferribacteraceae bacterium V6Fe1]|nr:phosphatidylglycerophosphatase A [Deferribacteraceae bacterium V6Fe1]
MHNFFILLATGFYSGYSKYAPGTVGTLVALPILGLSMWFSLLGKFFIFLLLFVLGIVASEYYESYKEKKDPKEVVIDEIAAYYFILIFIDLTFVNIILTFLLFRFFDITKIYPANVAESVGGGTGIMLDDMVAALYSILVFFILRGILW